jgi:hypothetical protein
VPKRIHKDSKKVEKTESYNHTCRDVCGWAELQTHFHSSFLLTSIHFFNKLNSFARLLDLMLVLLQEVVAPLSFLLFIGDSLLHFVSHVYFRTVVGGNFMRFSGSEHNKNPAGL